MAKYYHMVYEKEKKQLYVFNVTETDQEITLDSIWMIIQYGEYETKVVMNINEILQQIASGSATPLPLVAEQSVEDAMKELIAAQNHEPYALVIEDEIPEDEQIDPLIEAADKAAEYYNESYDEVIQRKIDEQKATKPKS